MGDFSSNSSNSNNNFGAAGKYQLPDFNIDASKIVRRPNNGPEYLPYNQKRGRDILSRTSFNTGVLWLSGFTFGGLYGAAHGYRNAPHPSFKVKMNSLLNGMSKYGSMNGSFLGVAAFLHTVSLWAADKFEEEVLPASLRTEQFSIIASGAIPGAAMFAHRGPRAAALAAVIGSTITWGYYTGLSKVGDLFEGKGNRGPRF
mmetsp:Transcript_5275/g.5775  ORF Transcript_5275/g.5775 Transcript_5275/m.5775 type:complete len:201 (+) Transcript_5275:83-685(+)|eukprot:CAMPEP_0173144314 /NCGR_PEP_ID=MMETSP1105-20130129/7155_1 /TAXON_ID=2985 /ORGANISM="Ochromonas sp., Strain BG-1" /LENGTH=200 /DNA_ID=CAMNT_0014057963 /DNA_START=82 /DNA_END=684 /DNA_ORIENTATION=+